jgi:hypothetical protein
MHKIRVGILIATVVAGCAACDRTSNQSAADAPQAASAPAAPALPSTDMISPVYPQPADQKSLNLDYVSFAAVDNDAIAVVPLPPFVGKPATLRLKPAAGGYVATAGNANCAGPVAITLDGATVATLDVHGQASADVIVPDGTPATGGMLGVQMAPGAGANFNCSVTVRPRPATPAMQSAAPAQPAATDKPSAEPTQPSAG